MWLVDFGSNPERPEQAFQRPAVIVSDDRLHHPRLRIVIVVPGITTIRRLPLHVVVEPEPSNGSHRTDGVPGRTSPLSQHGQARLTSRVVGRSVERVVDDVLRDVLHLATD